MLGSTEEHYLWLNDFSPISAIEILAFMTQVELTIRSCLWEKKIMWLQVSWCTSVYVELSYHILDRAKKHMQETVRTFKSVANAIMSHKQSGLKLMFRTWYIIYSTVRFLYRN